MLRLVQVVNELPLIVLTANDAFLSANHARCEHLTGSDVLWRPVWFRLASCHRDMRQDRLRGQVSIIHWSIWRQMMLVGVDVRCLVLVLLGVE